MISALDAAAAVGIGLAGAGHCLGMCGGIAAALNLGQQRGIVTTLAYHAGRLCSYAALGAILAGLAGTIDLAQWTLSLRYLAAVLLVAMGLSIGGWWRGISVLERAGSFLWKPVQRLVGKLLPLRHWSAALVLGLGWGLMPCGLIYSALAWSATSQHAASGALLMLLFGLGTLPAMLGASVFASFARDLLSRRGLKKLLAVALIAAGLWSFAVTWSHRQHLTQPYGGDSPGLDQSSTKHQGMAH